MSYLEELLPEFRKGAKIREQHWNETEYFCLKNNEVYDQNDKATVFDGPQIYADDWELYRVPEPDWQYIIDNKCLCWFWNNNEKIGKYSLLIKKHEKAFQAESNQIFYELFKNCRPVRRDEVTFYEDK